MEESRQTKLLRFFDGGACVAKHAEAQVRREGEVKVRKTREDVIEVDGGGAGGGREVAGGVKKRRKGGGVGGDGGAHGVVRTREGGGGGGGGVGLNVEVAIVIDNVENHNREKQGKMTVDRTRGGKSGTGGWSGDENGSRDMNVDGKRPAPRNAMALLMAKTKERPQTSRVKKTGTQRERTTATSSGRTHANDGGTRTHSPKASGGIANNAVNGAKDAAGSTAHPTLKPIELRKTKMKKLSKAAANQFHYGYPGPIHVGGGGRADDDVDGRKSTKRDEVPETAGADEVIAADVHIDYIQQTVEMKAEDRGNGATSEPPALLTCNALVAAFVQDAAIAHADGVRFRPMHEQTICVQHRGAIDHSAEHKLAPDEDMGAHDGESFEETGNAEERACRDASAIAAFAANLYNGSRSVQAPPQASACAMREMEHQDDELIDQGILCPGDISTLRSFTSDTISKLAEWYVTRASGQSSRNELWTTVYRASCARDVCGNNAGVYSLRNWLQEWRETIYKLDTCPVKQGTLDSDSDYFQSYGDAETDDMKAVHSERNLLLVSGGVGVSKTESVYACAEELGFEIIEVNASEKRSGAHVLNLVGEAAKSQNLVDETAQSIKHAIPTTVTALGAAAAGGGGRKHAVLHDDVECGGDVHATPGRRRLTMILFDELETIGDDERGFSSAVQSISQSSQRPIILTSKVRAPKCLSRSLALSQIHFDRQSTKDACLHTVMCLMSQKMCFNMNSLKLISTLLNGDVRRLLSHLQFWAERSGRASSTETSVQAPASMCLVQRTRTVESVAALKHVMPHSTGILYAFKRWPRVLCATPSQVPDDNAITKASDKKGKAIDGDSLLLLESLKKACSMSGLLSAHDAMSSHLQRAGVAQDYIENNMCSPLDFRLEEIASAFAEEEEKDSGSLGFADVCDIFFNDSERDASARTDHLLLSTLPGWLASCAVPSAHVSSLVQKHEIAERARDDDDSDELVIESGSGTQRGSREDAGTTWSRLADVSADVQKRIDRRLAETGFSRTPGWLGVATESKLLKLQQKQYGRRRSRRPGPGATQMSSFTLFHGGAGDHRM